MLKNKNEFQQKLLPIEELDSKGVLEVSTHRRDFFKYLGFSTAAAVLVAGCRTAVRRSVPFISKPEAIVPGMADYYATTFVCDNEVVPIVAKVRDGRPIKIEGNTFSRITSGGTSSRVQASVLSLYDTARLRNPIDKTGEKAKQITYSKVDEILKQKISSLENKKIVVVSPTLSSEADKEVLKTFRSKYPNTEIVYYDPISYNGIMQANYSTFNTYKIPTYRFDKAQTIVSLDADFLGTWISPIEFAKQWSANRKIDALNNKMSRHYQIESLMSMTGANADERHICKPSEIGQVALAFYNYIKGDTVNNTLPSELNAFIQKIAKELKEKENQSLIISGSQNVNVQIIINVINNMLGNYGNTISWKHTYSIFESKENHWNNIVREMSEGNVGAVFFVNGANPIYNSSNIEAIKNALKKVPLRISFSSVMDETSQSCHYILPVHHGLESWGDASLQSKEVYFQQPTIAPLFQTRYWQQTFLYLSNRKILFENFFKEYWKKNIGSQAKFNKVLQEGIMYRNGTKDNAKKSFDKNLLSIAIQNITKVKSSSIEVTFYEKVSLGNGSMANNPWLQEMPDPITKTTWDNYAVISPSMAKQLGITVDDKFEVEVDKPVVDITIQNKTISLPVNVIPGTHPNVIGIAVGYGRTHTIGKAGGGIGKNVYHLTTFDTSDFRLFYNTVSKINLNSEKYPLAITQSHNSYEGRKEVVKEFTLKEFKHNPNEIIEERKKEFQKYGKAIDAEDKFRKQSTLYPDHKKYGIKWGMSMDLNLCIGCNACVVACNAENNVSVVGKKSVLKAQEMHWIRIDRYFSGDENNPEVVFQPIMCQHCDNAPCENVCPVAATNHSSEGLNQMIYNRCIGTRYCANNCPYKVRRFNWADWNGADSFKNNQVPLVEEGYMDEVVLEMNDDLTRMVLNPDVTVRSRGVIEKCSFCVQRLQHSKLNAKKQNRPLQDGDVQTACMQACPTHAINFGNVNDENSKISIMRNQTHKQRLYYVLESIHVLPNVNYLAKIRNKSNHNT